MNAVDILSDAIKKQRWYFFKNNNKIIFDRDTGLIWTNLQYFPYKNKDGSYYHSSEVKNFVSTINFQNWGGYNNWQVPNPFELWQMIEDKTFPFQEGNYWRIMKHFGWCVMNSGVLSRKDLDYSGALAGITADTITAVILCSNALKPAKFSSESSVILDIFKKNNLVPMFKDYEANIAYKKFLSGKPDAPAMIDFSRYDAAAINQSPIKFYKAVKGAADDALNYLQEYETAVQIPPKISVSYTDSPHLSPEENNLLAERQNFFVKRFDPCTDDTKAQILSFKAQAEELEACIDKINHAKNSLRVLAELEKVPRVSFEFFIENLAQILNFATDKINFFAENKNFVTAIVENFAAWTQDYISFKTNLRAQFENLCNQNSIDAEIYNTWYSDWQKLRFNIEGRALPLAEFALKENAGDAAISALEKLAAYKGDIDNFYLNDRKSIYQKFAFQTGGDLQEKFEVESSLYKLTEKFQRALQEIIFACEKTEARVFLLRWAELLTNIPIDEITAFVEDKKLDAISAEVLNQFAELKRQNFTAYLADSQSYGAALQKREQEFNALVFKMRKGLR